MSKGYSYSTVLAIREANPELPGVRLGLHCLERGISVHDVAKAVGASRRMVYLWMVGRYHPRSDFLAKIERFMADT